MTGRLKKIADLIGNMGMRYTLFRARHELLRRTGLYRKRFPAAPPFKQYITLDAWKATDAAFFFQSRTDIKVKRTPSPQLAQRYEDIVQGRLQMFSNVLMELGTDYDWITNPDTGHRYDVNAHWTAIPDYSPVAGDIKYVWEKSRFSWLYDVIRYDYHHNQHCAAMVFANILSWIKANPVNCGPNYRCSQEMSLRVLNWTFALYYYRNAPELTTEIFDQMQYAIYWHLHHIYNNIHFSRIAVRNNHAITETLTLYLCGILYPSLPGAGVWKQQGKAWLEEEIAYQIYEDGTFLQYSMNYHRVVVQLLTWGIVLAGKNGERFSGVVYDRALKSLTFLRTCMIDEHGWLPNYGANDGALFFPLSTAHYRDYRPQLAALAAALGVDAGIAEGGEDSSWYGIDKEVTQHNAPQQGCHSFPVGGYYVIREQESLTFIRCGSYKDRPSQADNLHLDIWHKGVNVLTDAGSYKYNTDAATIRYFSGTQAHNTVMVNGQDQMLKGGRFIWYYWSRNALANLSREGSIYTFTGSVNMFRHIAPGIVHKRTVTHAAGSTEWTVRDELTHLPVGADIAQLWHVPNGIALRLHAVAGDGTVLQSAETEGWQSSLYGSKVSTQEYSFTSPQHTIETVISLPS